MKFRNVTFQITHDGTCTYKLAETTIRSDLHKQLQQFVTHWSSLNILNLHHQKSCLNLGSLGVAISIHLIHSRLATVVLSQLGSSNPKACRPRESKPARLRTFTDRWNMVKRTESETQIIVSYIIICINIYIRIYIWSWNCAPWK